MKKLTGARAMPERSTQHEIASHLAFPPRVPGQRWTVSGLMAALRDARQATGRDLADGRIVDTERCGSWLGNLGYMIFLEHVGYCFKPKDAPLRSREKKLIKALRYFSTLKDDESTFALYALRCAFAHTYQLFNVPRSNMSPETRQLLTHHFRLVNEETDAVVALGTQRWDGDPWHRSPLNWTTVNLRAFGNVADAVHHRLSELNTSEELEIALEGGIESLRLYSFGTQVA